MIIGQKEKFLIVYREYTDGLTTIAYHSSGSNLSLIASTVYVGDREKALTMQPLFNARAEEVVRKAIDQHDNLCYERQAARQAEEDQAEIRRLANNAAALARNQEIERALEGGSNG